jgi:hypothetical protein
MIIVIDLDLQQAVQGFGSRVPAPSITVKSQDTPTLAIYFAKGNVNYDLGTSPGLRFGVFGTGPNALVGQNTFTRTLDAQSRVCYVGYPNFNTTQMLAAIGTQASINCLGEIRYQTSFGTIARILDLDFVVQRSLLTETVLDTTTAAFTVPAVNANVTIAINSTSWLSAGLNLAIGAGAGAYQVVSITDGTHFVAMNQGGAGNAALATVIPSGTNVGIAATNVVQTYPDASLLELITRKGVASGYAGLNSSAKLIAAAIPVDGTTISLSGAGNLQSAAIISTTTANFTTPASGGTVNVAVASSSAFVIGQWVRLPIAGYYLVTAIPDGTHVTIENLGDPWNAGSGVTITSGAPLLPWSSLGGTGGGGASGQNAFSNLTASFTVPASGATVSVALGSTAWLAGSGYVVFIAGAGYYAVSSVTDVTHAVLTNLGYANTNVAAGTVIPSGSQVSPGGVSGAASTSTGSNAYDATSASFTMPAAATTVNIGISNTNWLGIGQEVYIVGAGYFSVQSITSPTIFVGVNSNYPGAAAPGSTIASGAHVSPAGLIGPAGAGGAGLNAFTTLTANFTQPGLSATVTITVGTTAWMGNGQIIYITGGGYYSVSSIGDLTHATITNLGYAGNVTPGGIVSATGTINVSPAGISGVAGTSAYTTTTAPFTQPTAGSTVTVTVGATGWMAQGQNLFIPTAGYLSVSLVIDATHVVLTNSGTTGNASSGTVITSGAQVSPAGSIGPIGATGPTGPAGSGGSGGGVDLQDPENGIEWSEHFVPPQTFSLTNAVMTLPWSTINPGGANFQALPTGLSLLGSGPEMSAIAIGSNPAANGYIDLTLGSSGTANNWCVPIGLGICTFKAKVAVDSLVTSADALKDQIGIFRYSFSGGLVGGFFFEYDYSQSANWRCCVRTGTGTTNVTYVDSGVTIAANTWYKFKVVSNAVWTSFAFYINNTLVATITTNVPTPGTDTALAPHFLQVRTAYTANKFIYCGYFYLNYPFTN